jgi:hypothetical protein
LKDDHSSGTEPKPLAATFFWGDQLGVDDPIDDGDPLPVDDFLRQQHFEG